MEDSTSITEDDMSASYHAIEWTPSRVEYVSKMYSEAPLTMSCNNSRQEKLPGVEWEGVEHQVLKMRPMQRKSCSSSGKSLWDGEFCDQFSDCFY